MKDKNLFRLILGIGLTLILLGCGLLATPAPTATSLPPTPTPVPPTPTAVSMVGKTFTGPLGDGGTITFTVSADGLMVEAGIVLVMKNISCAEGGGSLVEMKITIPHAFPIVDGKFTYGSDNMFQPGYGMGLIGQFDSATSAKGTFKYQDTNRPFDKPCNYGPYEWMASAQ